MRQINTKTILERATYARKAHDHLDYIKTTLDRGWKIYTEADLDKACTDIDSMDGALHLALAPIGLALADAQSRCTARTVSAEAVADLLYDLTERLAFIPKKHLDGATLELDPEAQSFPSAYKYTPESTHIYATYKAGSWRITDITRERCTTHKCTLRLPEAAKASLVDHYEHSLF